MEDYLRKTTATKVGLSNDAEWKLIDQVNSKKTKKDLAAKLGLPKDADWKEIKEASLEKNRKKMAVQIGLPETATWDQIKYYTKKKLDIINSKKNKTSKRK